MSGFDSVNPDAGSRSDVLSQKVGKAVERDETSKEQEKHEGNTSAGEAVRKDISRTADFHFYRMSLVFETSAARIQAFFFFFFTESGTFDNR